MTIVFLYYSLHCLDIITQYYAMTRQVKSIMSKQIHGCVIANRKCTKKKITAKNTEPCDDICKPHRTAISKLNCKISYPISLKFYVLNVKRLTYLSPYYTTDRRWAKIKYSHQALRHTKNLLCCYVCIIQVMFLFDLASKLITTFLTR